MAIRRNPDGSITVGILPKEDLEVSEPKAEKPSPETPKKPTKKRASK